MKRFAWGLAGVLWSGTAATGAEPTYPDIIVRAGDAASTGKILIGLAEVKLPPFSFRAVVGEEKPTGHGRTYTGRTYLDRACCVEDVRTGRCTVKETLIKIERPNDSFLEMKALENLKGR